MDLKGTKTEKNLMEAFAGESQQETNILIMQARQKKMALSKSLLFSKKLPTMKRNTQSFGLSFSTALAIHMKISLMQQLASMRNGQICISVWQTKQSQRASTQSQCK